MTLFLLFPSLILRLFKTLNEKNIIVLGSDGQLGSEFARHGIKNSQFNWIFINRQDLDLKKLTSKSFSIFLNKHSPALFN